MRRNAALVLVAALLVASIAAVGVTAGAPDASAPTAATAAPANGTTIGVSASGSASAEPDRAVLSVAVVATADSADAARQRVAANASRLRDALAGVGVPADAVETTSYRVTQHTEKHAIPFATGGTAASGAATKRPYEAVHAFEVTIDDPSKAGRVLDAAVSGGANRVDGVRFTLSDATRADLRTRAIREAMADARSRADAAASASGLSVATVDHVSIGRSGRPVVYASAGASGGARTVVDHGPVTVTVSVRATYTAT